MPKDLIARGIKKKLIALDDDEKYIVYLNENRRRNYSNPEEKAQALLNSIDEYLLAELGIDLPEASSNTLKDRIFIRSVSDVSGGRVDPKPYLAVRLNAIQSIRNGRFDFAPLADLVAIQSDKISGDIQSRRYVGLENVEGETGQWIPSVEVCDQTGCATVFSEEDVLFPKLRPYLNKVFYAEFSGVCSTEFMVLRVHSFDSQFLTYFLRSKIVVLQPQCLMSGNTLPRLSIDDIRELLIPVPPMETQQDIVSHISSIRATAKQLQTEAAAGLEQAQAEVEKMILGGE